MTGRYVLHHHIQQSCISLCNVLACSRYWNIKAINKLLTFGNKEQLSLSILCNSLQVYIDGLIQERCSSFANALEFCLSCTNPLICDHRTMSVSAISLGGGGGGGGCVAKRLRDSPQKGPVIDGILPKGPYPPCLRMADRALLTGHPRHMENISCRDIIIFPTCRRRCRHQIPEVFY